MKKIILYSGNSCTNCTAAKEYIKEKGYDYEEKNVSLDQEAKKELIGMGYMGVPVIMIDDDVVVGFNKSKLDELL